MIERASSQGEPPVPLTLTAGQRIVTLGLEPVFGWTGDERARAAQALILPSHLLEPRPTETVYYGCNIPSLCGQPPLATEDKDGARSCEAGAAFLKASRPGGQVSVVFKSGNVGIVQFRWACVTRGGGKVSWRCFWQLCSKDGARAWTPAPRDCIFDAGRGFLVDGPGSQAMTFGDVRLTLLHPEGRLTSFPCQSGCVKVTRLSADGWRRRELLNLMLHADRSIVARFTDGKQSIVATAAPAGAAIAA